MNHKQKQAKHKPNKGAPYGEDSSSGKKKQGGDHLGDLPGFNKKIDNDYDFGGFDDFGDGDSEQNKNEQSKYSNAEKYLDDFDNEQKEGFKVEVQRQKPGKQQQTSSGKKKSKFNKNVNHMGNVDDVDEIIEEEIHSDRDKDLLGANLMNNIEGSHGHTAGITVSQSLGIDPSVDSLALDEYDHIEVVEVS